MSDLQFSQNDGIDISVPTQTDLSAKQYFFVKLDTSELCVICGANDKTLGVLQNAPDGSTNETIANVRVAGVTKILAAETLTFGQFLTPTSVGDAEVCDAADEEYGAIALTSAEDGDLCTALIAHGEVTASDA